MRTLVWLVMIGVGILIPVSQTSAQRLEQLEQDLDRAADARESRDSSAPLPPPEDTNRPTLGLSTAEEGEPGGGLLIDKIVPDGPAAKAGLREGDLIKQANGKPVNSADELGELLSGAKVGDRVAFTIRSLGRDKVIDVVFARRAQSAAAPERSGLERVGGGVVPARTTPRLTGEDPLADSGDEPAIERPTLPLPRGIDPTEPATDTSGRPTLGVSVGPVTDEAAARYGVPTRRGALITMVRPEGPADRAGLPVGGVVVAMDGVRIDTADQLVDAVRTSRPGQEIELSYYNGPTMTRKTVRLGSAGPAPVGIGEPSPRTNRIDLGPAPGFGPAATDAPMSTEAGNVAALRQELQQLREQIRALQQRLDRIEQAPAGGAAAEEDGGAAASPPRFAPPTP